MAFYVPLKKFHKAWCLLRKFSFSQTSILGEKLLFKCLVERQTQQAPGLDHEIFLQGGIVVPKKLGNAVVRNKLKRRLRQGFRHVAKLEASSMGMVTSHETTHVQCLVLVRHKDILTCPFVHLCHSIQEVVTKNLLLGPKFSPPVHEKPYGALGDEAPRGIREVPL